MKVEFRSIGSSDLDLIRGWRNTSSISHNMYNDHEISEEEHKKWFSSIKDRDCEKHFLVHCDGKPSAVVNIKKIDRVNKNAEWAFYIGDENLKGGGLAILMEIMLLDMVFDEIGLHKLNSGVIAFNEKVIELHKKFGFREEGRLRDQIFRDGSYHDVILMGITSDEWKAAREGFRSIKERLSK